MTTLSRTEQLTTEYLITEELPRPSSEVGITWRPLHREDLPALHRLLLAVDEADGTDFAGTLEDMQTQFDDPWSRPDTDSLAAFAPDGRIAAMARTFANPEPEEEVRLHLWVEAHPDFRADLEEPAMAWAEARGRQRAQSMPDQLPRLLRYAVDDTLADRIARIEQHGFSPVRYFNRMRRDLSQLIPDQSLPDGLVMRRYEPELSGRMLAAMNEAFRDHWSFEAITQEDWQMFFLARASFRPDLTFVAMDGDEVAGMSFNTVSPEENARSGIEEGWVAELAVRRPWRRRGVASALLRASMRAFKAEGLDYATLGVDTENPTGALGLYQRLGFVRVKRFVVFEQAID